MEQLTLVVDENEAILRFKSDNPMGVNVNRSSCINRHTVNGTQRTVDYIELDSLFRTIDYGYSRRTRYNDTVATFFSFIEIYCIYLYIQDNSTILLNYELIEVNGARYIFNDDGYSIYSSDINTKTKAKDISEWVPKINAVFKNDINIRLYSSKTCQHKLASGDKELMFDYVNGIQSFYRALYDNDYTGGEILPSAFYGSQYYFAQANILDVDLYSRRINSWELLNKPDNSFMEAIRNPVADTVKFDTGTYNTWADQFRNNLSDKIKGLSREVTSSVSSRYMQRASHLINTYRSIRGTKKCYTIHQFGLERWPHILMTNHFLYMTAARTDMTQHYDWAMPTNKVEHDDYVNVINYINKSLKTSPGLFKKTSTYYIYTLNDAILDMTFPNRKIAVNIYYNKLINDLTVLVKSLKYKNFLGVLQETMGTL